MFLTSILQMLNQPHWLTFFLVAGIGLSGLLALIALYPVSRDSDDDTTF